MSVQEVNESVPADTLALRLVIARHHAGGLSAREAAHLVSASGQTWRNWEDGKHTPRPEMLAWIARQLDVDENWLRKGGPLRAFQAPDGGGRPRQDSNLRPADYTSPPSDLAKYRERRKTGSRRRFFRRGLEAA